jgi:uncharacterized RDD family membrane protein YckC
MATDTLTASPPSGHADDGLDTSIRLVTPERITFQYPLAGPFRRAFAYLIDVLVMVIVFFCGSILATFLSLGSSASLGLIFVLLFALMFGYGAFFEAVFNGQTPGKMAMKLRVVSDQGVAINGMQAVLRNLLWGFDGFALGYIPAIACMLVTQRFQRLGDLAAGTMVMVETTPARGIVHRVNEPAVQKLLPWLPVHAQAGPELTRALADYVRHRDRFGAARREEMAGHLARPLRVRYDLPPDATADAVVCAYYHRVFIGE